MCGSLHIEIGGDIHPEERNMVQRVYNICPQTQQKKSKSQTGRKSSKLKETVRNSKVSLLERILIE